MLGKIKQWIWIVITAPMVGGFYLQDILHEILGEKEILCLKNTYSFENDFVHYSVMWCEGKKDIAGPGPSGKFLSKDCFKFGGGKIFDSQEIVLKQKRRPLNGPQRALSWRGLGSPIKWAQSHSAVIRYTDRFGEKYQKILSFPSVNSNWFQNRSCNIDNTHYFVERDNEEAEMDLMPDFDSVEDLVYNIDYYEERNEAFTEDVQCDSEKVSGRIRIKGPDGNYAYRYYEPGETDIGLIYQDEIGMIQKAKSCSVFDAMKSSFKVLSRKRWLEKYEGKVIEGVGYANKKNSIWVWLGPNDSSVNITGEDYDVKFPSDQKRGKLVRYKGTVIKMEDRGYRSRGRWVEDYDLYLDGNFYPLSNPKEYFEEDRESQEGFAASVPRGKLENSTRVRTNLKSPATPDNNTANEHKLVFSENPFGKQVYTKQSYVDMADGDGHYNFFEPKDSNILFKSCKDGYRKKTESCSVFEAIRNDFQNFSQMEWEAKYAGKWISGIGFANRVDAMWVWMMNNPHEAVYIMLDGSSEDFNEQNVRGKRLGYEGVIRKMVKSKYQRDHYLYLEGRFWINDKG